MSYIHALLCTVARVRIAGNCATYHVHNTDVILLVSCLQSRYPHLRVRPISVQHLYDTDELSVSPTLRPGSVRVKKTSGIAGGEVRSEASRAEEKAVESGSPAEDNKENIPKTTGSKEVKSTLCWSYHQTCALYVIKGNLCHQILHLILCCKSGYKEPVLLQLMDGSYHC